MKWYELYNRIGRQNIGHTRRNEVCIFVNDKKYVVSNCIYEKNGKLVGLKCSEVRNETSN